MKKFILKMFLMLVLIFVTLIIIILIPPNENLYLAEIKEKSELLNSIKSPRIILAGGSNLAFGIDSKKIEFEIGLPVVNMGLHAGTGLKFFLDNIKPYIGKDDILIISLEYSQFYNNNIYGGGPLIEVLNFVPEEINNLNVKQLKAIFKYFFEFIKWKNMSIIKEILNREGGVYSKDSFNKYGDVIAHLNLESQDISKESILNNCDKINYESFKYLNNFFKYVENNGAKAYVSFPCIPQTQYMKSLNKIEEIYEIFQENSFNLISTPNQYVFPDNLFFDTVYHLNQKGRNIRTKTIINDIKKILK